MQNHLKMFTENALEKQLYYFLKEIEEINYMQEEKKGKQF